MKKYLIDTNIISYLGDSSSPYHQTIKACFESLKEEDQVCVCVISLYELSYGLHCFTSKQLVDLNALKQSIDFIKQYLDILPLGVDEVEIFGSLKSAYQNFTGITNKTNKKNDFDFLIASSAINYKATLVSHDKIFADLSSLRSDLLYEDWLKD